MAIHDDILGWAQKRPPWQQDALRRLVETKELSGEDLDELTLLCKSEAGLAPPPDCRLEAVPITAPDLGSETQSSRDAVALLKLDGVTNVNALAEDQPVAFAGSGLTVIFGDNGTGKTGFGRLLRTLCWARRRPKEILKNTYTDDQRPPGAKVHYTVGSVAKEIEWVQGTEAPSALRKISVFDSDCASVYINEAQQATYLPFGLDLFARLAKVCDTVRSRLTGELTDLQSAYPVWPEDLNGATMLSALQRLPSEEAIADLEAVSPLTTEEATRLEELTKLRDQLKKDDPLREAKTLRVRARRTADIEGRTRAVQDGLGSQVVEDLRSAITDAHGKAEAALKASKILAGEELLPGTGDAIWKELWEVARRFSNEAYADKDFPYTEEDARCVLCQQELGGEAASRLLSFESFVKNEIAEQATISAGVLGERRQAIRAIACDWADLETAKAELNLITENLGESLAIFLEWAGRRKEWMLAVSHDSNWSEIPSMDGAPADLAGFSQGLVRQAEALESSIDPTQRAVQEEAWLDLNARAWIVANGPAISAEVDRLRKIAVLKRLTTSDTDTTGITTTANRLTKKHVTEALKTRFRTELQDLRLTHLEVIVEKTEGAKGVTAHHLTLDRGRERKVSEILSAGEKNCVALAAFFAELDPEGTDGIIFDDPVSSLDQDKRDFVALRLVRESTHRQVIIWTHDLAFLGSVHEWAERLKLTKPKILTIHNFDGRSGIVDDELPWPILKVKDRVKRLRDGLVELKRLSQASDVKGLGRQVEAFYRHLRDTWERAVEEVLFADVVQRWRKSVQTSRLREVADNVTAEDFARVTEGMSRCSNFVHDPTAAAPPPTPRLTDAEADLRQFEDWLKARSQRAQVNVIPPARSATRSGLESLPVAKQQPNS